jgi:hypothetical protein
MQVDHEQVQEDLLANPLDVAGEMRLYQALRHFWHPVMYSSELTRPAQAGLPAR